MCIQVVDEISKYENLENLNWSFNFNEETIEKWISRFIEYINAEGYGNFISNMADNPAQMKDIGFSLGTEIKMAGSFSFSSVKFRV